MNERSKLNLQLHILPSFVPPKVCEALYEASYALWKDVWRKTLFELDGTEQIFSDQFIRQDYFGVFTDGDQPVALCCFKEMQLEHQTHREDSWFKPWPADLLTSLSREHKRWLVPSWLTVHPDYRRTKRTLPVDFAAMGIELIALMCLDTKADIAVGTPRNDRSVSQLLYRVGGKAVKKDVIHHGVSIDLVTMLPQDIKEANGNISFEMRRLWKSRVDLRIPPGETKKRAA